MLLERYKNSPAQMLASVFPEYEWLPWKFSSRPREYWDDVKSQRNLAEKIGRELKIQEVNDWYKVSTKVKRAGKSVVQVKQEFIDLGGGILLIKNDTLPQALSHIFPEHEWLPGKFQEKHNSIWRDETIANYFIQTLKKEELPYLSKIIRETGNQQDILPQLLSKTFPHFNWNVKKTFSKKSQFLLKECLRKLFPDEGKKN